MDKSRTIGVPSSTTTVVYVPHGSRPALNNLILSVPSYDGLNEQINYTQFPRPSDNSCLHRKTTRNRPRTGIITYAGGVSDMVNYYEEHYDNPAHWWISFYPSAWGQDAHSNSDLFSGDPLTLVNLQDKVDASMAYMLPGIRPNISLLNSIYELKDFKSFPKLLKRANDFIARLPAFLNGRTTKAYRRKTLRQLTRLGAEGFLSYEFAIAPLLRDITAIRNILTTTREKLKKLVENNNKPQIAHYVSKTARSTIVDTSPFTVSNHFNGGIFKRTIECPDGIVFRAAMAYSYRITSSGNLYERALLDNLGININPSIIWNAVPWSFVIDWVANVGSWLDQFTRKNLRIVTAIHRYNCSVKVRGKCTLETMYSVDGPGPQVYNATQTVESTGYHRQMAQPDLARHLALSGLDSKEFSYIGALILARL